MDVNSLLHSINWWAVGACFVWSVVSGSIWFGPKTFFPAWWKAIGKKVSDPADGSPKVWILLMLGSLVQCVFVAVAIQVTGSKTLVSGLLTGLVIWAGIVAPAALVNKLFSAQIKAWVIETGAHLLNMLVFGALLGVWHK